VPDSGSQTVAPESTTTYTITAINSAGQTASQSVTLTVSTTGQTVTLTFLNYLIDDAIIAINGNTIGTVPASQPSASSPVSQQFVVPSVPSMIVTYDVFARTNQGDLVGDPIYGTVTLSSPTGTVNIDISNVLLGETSSNNTYYFAPIITNDSSSGTLIAMAVNYGLVGQNECDCTVAPGSGPTNIGYYILYSNSNVYAFANNYNGASQAVTTITAQSNSGVTNLTFSY